MKKIVLIFTLGLLLSGCGTMDEVRKIVYDEVKKEKNSELKGIKEECANDVFSKLDNKIFFLSDAQEILIVLAVYSCSIEKRVENLEQKANYFRP